LYALNSDGSVKGIKRPGAGNYSAPAIGSDGTIYVPDSVALYAFELSATGPAWNPWQMRNASARNDAMALDILRPPEFDRAALSYVRGSFNVRVTASSGGTVTLYTSMDLTTWTVVDAKIIVNGAAEFEHANSAGMARWYKAAMQ
jgi:hypothetical protein